MSDTFTLRDKYNALLDYLRSFGSVLVAYSGGVDSTFLLRAAHEALGNNMAAVTAVSPFFPNWESMQASEYCKLMWIKQFVLEYDPISVPEIRSNPANRCYLCKKTLFGGFLSFAMENGYNAVIEGSNIDDLSDYRPGLAAIDELGIKSPLRDLEFTKDEIRILSKEFGLPTWNKPSFACLASRVPYGEEITADKLYLVECAEELLLQMGFEQCRVRIHGTLARIELYPEDMARIMEDDVRMYVFDRFKEIGFDYVSLDMRGYRTGSLNEVLLRDNFIQNEPADEGVTPDTEPAADITQEIT